MYTIEEKALAMVYFDLEENTFLRLPKERFAGFIPPMASPKPSADFIEKAFEAPVHSPRLRDLAQGGKNAVILVSDATRQVPTASVLPKILKELEEAGLSAENVSCIVATGVHRRATPLEMRQILGDGTGSMIRIENHDPFDPAKLVDLGKTSLGTPIYVNKNAYEADLRIVVGKVEPHEFAGFSGGRKSVLPGIVSETTIGVNHRPEMILHPKATIGEWKDNPVSKDMTEAARMLGVDFCVNILVDSQNRPTCVICGDLEKSHALAIEKVAEGTSVPLKTRPRIIVTTPGSPLNINFYQSMKAIIATAPIMAENGVIILYSRCAEGMGSEDMLLPFEKGKSVDETLAFLFGNYKIQMDHALLLCKILQSGVRVIVVSKNLSPKALEKMHILSATSLNEALETAFSILGRDESVLFYPCPQRTLPYISEDCV